MRHLTRLDDFISKIDNGLKTLTEGANMPARALPEDTSDANKQSSDNHSDDIKKHTAALMRINHTGEVCAQALYQGQSLTARSLETREALLEAAEEEIDHLAWCETRIKELGSHTSVLNPLFYGMSFTIGAVTGAIGDKISLGFVEATEDQVCKHLESHLEQIPESDTKSRQILEQMLIDEQKHGIAALEQGGAEFPKPVKKGMSLLSKVMTGPVYHV